MRISIVLFHSFEDSLGQKHVTSFYIVPKCTIHNYFKALIVLIIIFFVIFVPKTWLL